MIIFPCFLSWCMNWLWCIKTEYNDKGRGCLACTCLQKYYKTDSLACQQGKESKSQGVESWSSSVLIVVGLIVTHCAGLINTIHRSTLNPPLMTLIDLAINLWIVGMMMDYIYTISVSTGAETIHKVLCTLVFILPLFLWSVFSSCFLCHNRCM